MISSRNFLNFICPFPMQKNVINKRNLCARILSKRIIADHIQIIKRALCLFDLFIKSHESFSVLTQLSCEDLNFEYLIQY